MKLLCKLALLATLPLLSGCSLSDKIAAAIATSVATTMTHIETNVVFDPNTLTATATIHFKDAQGRDCYREAVTAAEIQAVCRACNTKAQEALKAACKKAIKDIETTQKTEIAKLKAARKHCNTAIVVATTPVYTGPQIGDILIETPATTTPTELPPAVVVTPPATTIINDFKVGSIDPAVPLSAADQAIVDSILNGPKTLGTGRHRILLAADDYPGTDAQLNYCVFDVTKRHLLGLVKKFGVNPADIRVLRNSEYSRENLIKHVDWVFENVQPDDKRAVLLSSHGGRDTGPDGSVQGLVITHDMIVQNRWDATTEIGIEYWKAKCQSVPAGSNVALVFDLCHAGGDIRTLLSSGRTPRSYDGPAPVQQRLSVATKTTNLRDVNVYNVQFFPMCLESELSEEGPSTGGGGSWAMWTAFDADGVSTICTTICRDTNAALRSHAFSQHVTVLGRNAKAPLFSAVKP